MLPCAKGSLECFEANPSVRGVTVPENSPTQLADWIYTNRAQLGLHVVNFTDATLVTMVWLHTLLDVMGRKALLLAWTTVLEERDEDVPDFWGYDFDPLKDLGAEPQDDSATTEKSGEQPKREELLLRDWQLKGFQLFKFIFNSLWDMVFYPQEQTCAIVVPPAFMARLKTQAFQDMASAPSSLVTHNTADLS